jgi:hypothetical protein
MIRNSESDRCGLLFYARSGTPIEIVVYGDTLFKGHSKNAASSRRYRSNSGFEKKDLLPPTSRYDSYSGHIYTYIHRHILPRLPRPEKKDPWFEPRQVQGF